MSIAQKMSVCKEKIFQLHRFAFKNSGVSCLSLIFDLGNSKQKSSMQKVSSSLQDMNTSIQYLFSPRNLQGTETLLQPLDHFVWHLALQD